METVQFDFDAGPADLTVTDLAWLVPPILPPADIRLAVPIPSVPLRVLECVWLC